MAKRRATPAVKKPVRFERVQRWLLTHPAPRIALLFALVWVSLGLPARIFGTTRLVLFTIWIDLLLLGWIAWRVFGLDRRSREKRRLLGYRLEDLDRISGTEFERWVAVVLERAGLKLAQTKRGADYGVDLIVEGLGQRVAVEVKRRRGKVGNDVVRSVLSGARFHGCTGAAVVTQSSITREATVQARGADLPVLLLGRTALPGLAAEFHEFLRAVRGASRAP